MFKLVNVCNRPGIVLDGSILERNAGQVWQIGFADADIAQTLRQIHTADQFGNLTDQCIDNVNLAGIIRWQVPSLLQQGLIGVRTHAH